MAGIGGLFIDLALNTATFVTDINRINQNLDSMQKKANVALAKVANAFNDGRKQLNKFGDEMFSAKGIMLQLTGAAGFGLLIHKAIETASVLVDTADSVGLTTTQLQELQFAASQTGVNTEKFNLAMSKFIQNVGQAQQGDGSLVTTLKDHNITLLENIRHAANQNEALRLVADAIQHAKTSTEAATIATAAFGKGGVALVNMLRDGSIGLDEFAKQAEAAGIVINDGLVRAAENAGDKLELLGTFAMRQVTIEVAKMSPQLINLTENLITMLPTLIKIADVVGNAIVMVFNGWGKVLDYLEIGLVRTQEALGQLSKQVADEQIRLIGEQAQKSTKDVEAMNAALNKVGTGVAAPAPTANPNASLPTLKQMDKNKEDDKDLQKKAKKLQETTATPFEQYSKDLGDYNKMLEKGLIDWDTYNRAVTNATTSLDQHIGVMDGMKGIMDSFLNGQIHSWKDLGKAGMKALDDIMGNMLKMTLSGPGPGGIFSSIFGNIASGGTTGGIGASIGGMLSSAGSSISGAFSSLAGSFGGFFAEGGTLKPGQWGWAGENGPERIYAGNKPMNVEANGAGGRPIQINFNVSTPDANSFRRSQGQIAAQAALAIRGAGRNL